MMAAMMVQLLVACWDSWRDESSVAKWAVSMDSEWDAMTAEMRVV